MQTDGGWKERGVGALKLNVRESDGKGPRLGASSSSSLRSVCEVVKRKLTFSNASRRCITTHAQYLSLCRDERIGRWETCSNNCF
jgi:hypothetical protein